MEFMSSQQSWCMCESANHSHQMFQLHPGQTGAVLIWVGIFMIFTALLLKRSNAGTSFLSGDLQLEILIQILTSSDSVLFSYSSIPFFYSGSVLFRLKFWLFRFCNYYVFVPTGISWPHHNPEKQRHVVRVNSLKVIFRSFSDFFLFARRSTGQPKYPIQLGGYIFRLVEDERDGSETPKT